MQETKILHNNQRSLLIFLVFSNNKQEKWWKIKEKERNHFQRSFYSSKEIQGENDATTVWRICKHERGSVILVCSGCNLTQHSIQEILQEMTKVHTQNQKMHKCIDRNLNFYCYMGSPFFRFYLVYHNSLKLWRHSIQNFVRIIYLVFSSKWKKLLWKKRKDWESKQFFYSSEKEDEPYIHYKEQNGHSTWELIYITNKNVLCLVFFWYFLKGKNTRLPISTLLQKFQFHHKS